MKTKVLLFTTRFYPHVGGVEKVVADIFNYTSCDAYALVSNDTYNKFFQKLIPVRYDIFNGKKILRVWMNLPRSILGLISFSYRFLISCISIIWYIKNVRPDVVNYHFPDDSLIYFLFAHKILNFKYVVNIHGNDLHIFSKKYPNKLLFSNLIKNSRSVVVNTDYMKKELESAFPISGRKIVVIPNWINLKEIPVKNEINGLPKKYIFFVGRLVKKKGVDVLIKAFAKVSHSDLKLIIEGSGDEFENLKKLVAELHQEDRIIFTNGKLSHEEKFAYIKNSEFGVIPSRIEPFGIVALEYMACGTPIICSKTGGLAELINDGINGILFENESENDLFEKMTELLDNKELQDKIRKNELEFIKNFHVENVMKKYDELYVLVSKSKINI